MLYYSYTQKLFYCIAGIVIVCHFVRSLMAFVCQEIKGLLTYLLTYIATMLHVAQKLYRDRSKVTSDQSGQESRSGPV